MHLECRAHCMSQFSFKLSNALEHERRVVWLSVLPVSSLAYELSPPRQSIYMYTCVCSELSVGVCSTWYLSARVRAFCSCSVLE